jgi:hypothetical protein
LCEQSSKDEDEKEDKEKDEKDKGTYPALLSFSLSLDLACTRTVKYR